MKRNESITLLVTFTDDNNELMEVSVEDIKAQIRNNYNDFVAEFTVSQNEDLTSYTLECLDTSNFPLGELFFDVAVKMDNGSYKYSETMKIVVLEERTRE
ncbi:hypothetical protein J6W34_04610 [bacterium]|nr:hypothetical protein [bacterium]